MKTIQINTIPGFDQWRTVARQCLNDRIAPHNIIWNSGSTNTPDFQSDLFAAPTPRPKTVERSGQTESPIKKQRVRSASNAQINVPKAFLEMCETALCHTDPHRFSLCYRILWRLVFENKPLLSHKTDDDIIKLHALVKAVRRDAYKITAFLRFREISFNGTEHFVAWYEPEHYTLELKLDFFKTRFKNMRWFILTPYRAAHWHEGKLTLEDNPDPNIVPKDDKVEQYWLTYYANIFNPARPKKGAMLSQMPKKYWKNMPETALIQDLLKTSESRARNMIANAPPSEKT